MRCDTVKPMLAPLVYDITPVHATSYRRACGACVQCEGRRVRVLLWSGRAFTPACVRPCVYLQAIGDDGDGTSHRQAPTPLLAQILTALATLVTPRTGPPTPWMLELQARLLRRIVRCLKLSTSVPQVRECVMAAMFWPTNFLMLIVGWAAPPSVVCP